MKILYGIQGTGNGHISRSRMMAKYFSDAGVKVDYLFSGRPRNEFFDMEVFADYQWRKGLSFAVDDGKVQYFKTWCRNNSLRFFYDLATLKLDEYDLIISDFEPVTAWAGKLKNKLVMGVGHQYAFGDKTPLSGDNFFTRGILKNFAPVDIPIGLHWSAYNNYTLPPIINTELKKQSCSGEILVYLPFENHRRVIKLLNQFPKYHFIVYAPNVVEQEDYNVRLKRTCHQGFKEDLCKAAAVICNAGFELVSECLYFGLPVLVKPLNGQMEQLSNASALQALNYAEVMDVVNYTSLSSWLKSLQQPGRGRPLLIPDVAKALVDWIIKGDWSDRQSLAEMLWRPLRPEPSYYPVKKYIQSACVF